MSNDKLVCIIPLDLHSLTIDAYTIDVNVIECTNLLCQKYVYMHADTSVFGRSSSPGRILRALLVTKTRASCILFSNVCFSYIIIWNDFIRLALNSI